MSDELTLPTMQVTPTSANFVEPAITLSSIRAKYPQYHDLPDDQLLIGLHQKFYPDIPAGQFFSRIQYDTNKPDPSTGGSTLNIAGMDTGIPTSQGVNRFLSGAGHSMQNTLTGLGQLVGAVPQGDVDAAVARDKPLMATGAGKVGDIGGTVAQLALPGGVITKALPEVGAAMAARPLLTAAVQGGAYGAAQPVATGESRVVNAGLDAAGGLVGQGVASGLSRLAKGASDLIAPEVKALYDKATALGIPVTAAQLSDSTFVKTLQSALSKLPFAGGQAARAEQQGAFNTAVSRTFGENSPQVNSDLYAAAKGRIGGDFNRLSSTNSLNPSPQLANDLGAVSSDATKFGTSDSARAVSNAIDEILSHADPATGQIPGQAYQSFDSAMGKLMKGGDEKAHYIGQVRDAVRSAMDASISPADQAAWQTARSQYANLKTIRDLVAKGDGSGDISPALLMGRVTATNAGKERMASGNGGEMGDLAQIGRRFLRDPIPDSGTAQRNLLYSLMTTGVPAAGVGLGYATPGQALLGAGALGGAALLGRGTNALLNSAGLARYAVNGAGPAGNALALAARPAPYLLTADLNSR